MLNSSSNLWSYSFHDNRHHWTRHDASSSTNTATTRRYYTPMTAAEEEAEKARVQGLTAFAKEQELRRLNREIARLQMLHGINTGELYTWTGRYKVLTRDYGFPMLAWYGALWATSAAAIYAAIEVGGVDAMALVAYVDSYTGWNVVSHIDPTMGKIGLTMVVNEMIEPLRLPVVILTVKPVMDRLFPPKF